MSSQPIEGPRWFAIQAPGYDLDWAMFDVNDPTHRERLLGRENVPAEFLDGAEVGDFIDLDGRGRRILVRMGREWSDE
jgi:hypothetical protein